MMIIIIVATILIIMITPLIVMITKPPRGESGGNRFSNTTCLTQVFHTRHVLPLSEIDLGLFWADSTDLEGKICFTESAERVEYGKYAFFDSGE